MFTHDQIWMAIDRLAQTRNLSASGLARLAGLDPTSFNRSKRISPNGKPRWPSTESIAKILAVTESTMAELIDLIGDGHAAVRQVPLLGYETVKAGKLSEKNAKMLEIAFDAGAGSFAVAIANRAMDPLFRAGCVLVADPGKTPAAEDRVLFFVKGGGLMAGILQGNAKGDLRVLIPGENFRESEFAAGKIEWVARVLWASH